MAQGRAILRETDDALGGTQAGGVSGEPGKSHRYLCPHGRRLPHSTHVVGLAAERVCQANYW